MENRTVCIYLNKCRKQQKQMTQFFLSSPQRLWGKMFVDVNLFTGIDQICSRHLLEYMFRHNYEFFHLEVCVSSYAESHVDELKCVFLLFTRRSSLRNLLNNTQVSVCAQVNELVPWAKANIALCQQQA